MPTAISVPVASSSRMANFIPRMAVASREAIFRGHRDVARRVVVPQVGTKLDICDVSRWPRPDADRPVYTAEPPHVLALEVGAGRPAIDASGDGVLANMAVLGDVESGWEATVGREADHLAVHGRDGSSCRRRRRSPGCRSTCRCRTALRRDGTTCGSDRWGFSDGTFGGSAGHGYWTLV